MKVLIVDDEIISVKGIIDYCEEQHWETHLSSFEDFYKEIIVFNPDVIVLDWCDGPEDDSGVHILKNIWTNGYRPIVIFSGNVEIIDMPDKYKNSGLIRIIKKGEEKPVYEFLEEFRTSYAVLSSFREELGLSLIESFKALKPIQDASEGYLGDSIIKYILAKRTINYFDLEQAGLKLPPWTTYLYPPVIKDYLSVCDIIRKVEAGIDSKKIGKPEDYRIIVTPSCDMVINETREPKVDDVLCACCTSISGTEIGKQNHKLKSTLNAGFFNNEVPLPSLENILPDMIADMKKLELINIRTIAKDIIEYKENKDNFNYIRICSIDSPFKEQIVWAYLSNACRPGVPERDTDAWSRSIKNSK